MQALHEAGFPTPKPVDVNRHAILMSYVDAYTMCKVNSIKDPEKAYHECMDLLVRLAESGLIHGDFNEFNLMIDNEQNVTVIDFPQMVSIDHKDAEYFFQRDLECINTVFKRRYNYECNRTHTLKDIKVTNHIDQKVGASGSLQKTKAQQRREVKALENYMRERDEASKAKGENGNENEEISEEDEDEDDDNDENEEEIEFKDEIAVEDEESDDQMEEAITPNELEQETGEELKFEEDENDEEEDDDEKDDDEEGAETEGKKPKKKKTNKPIDEREFIRRALNKKFKKRKGFKGGKNKNKGKTKVGDFM